MLLLESTVLPNPIELHRFISKLAKVSLMREAGGPVIFSATLVRGSSSEECHRVSVLLWTVKLLRVFQGLELACCNSSLQHFFKCPDALMLCADLLGQ